MAAKTRQYFETAIAKTRKDLTETYAERDRIQRAPIPRGDAVAALRREFDRRAASWNPNVGATSGEYQLVVPAQHDTSLKPQIEAACAALLGDSLFDVLVAKLETRLAALPDGIAEGDRTRQLADLDAKAFDLETKEERLILDAEAAGFDLDRRGDAKPAIVLGATDDLDEAA